MLLPTLTALILAGTLLIWSIPTGGTVVLVLTLALVVAAASALSARLSRVLDDGVD
ncbi:MAG: hypothetical protein HZB46_06550 [Solirubrobacterales bacterium]|nr:hypothetical protein [Solirubrobacterales bacterium]